MKTNSIRFKVVALIASIGVILCLQLAFYSPYQAKRMGREIMAKDAEFITQILAENLGLGMQTIILDNGDALRQTLGQFETDDERRTLITRVRVFDPDMTMVAGMNADGATGAPAAVDRFELTEAGDAFTARSPMRDAGGTVLGYLEIEFSKAFLNRTSAGNTTVSLIWALVALVITVTASYYLIRPSVEALGTLTETAERIATGDVDVDIDFTSGDEIGMLAEAFRNLRDSQRQKSYVAQEIARGNLQVEVDVLGGHDALGRAMDTMKKSLTAMSTEVQGLVQGATDGRLEVRADADQYQGDYRAIVQGVNDSLDAVIGPLNEAAAYLDRISRGDTPEKITVEYKGDFNGIKNSMNRCVEILHGFVDQTGELITATEEGRLDVRAAADTFDGVWRKILRGFNDVIDGNLAPVNEATAVLERLAAGDLTQTVTGDYRGDHRKIKDAINATITSLRNIVSGIQSSANSVVNASEELSATARQISKGAEQQASSLEETSSSITEMGATIQETSRNVGDQSASVTQMAASIEQMSHSVGEVARNAQEVSRLAESASREANIGGEAVGKTVEGMGLIDGSVNELSQVIAGLGKRSEEIGNIVSTINDIAEQTNLLALNAAIEAARAGEHGKGFAVVADEVRKLAERSQVSTKDIGKLIKAIQEDTGNAVKTTEESTRSVQRGIELANDAGHSIEKIVASVNDTASLAREISGATDNQAQGSEQILGAVNKVTKITEQVSSATAEQAAGSDELVKSVESVNRITQQNKAAAGGMASSTDQLARLAEDLRRSIGSFKLDGGAGGAGETIAA